MRTNDKVCSKCALVSQLHQSQGKSCALELPILYPHTQTHPHPATLHNTLLMVTHGDVPASAACT